MLFDDHRTEADRRHSGRRPRRVVAQSRHHPEPLGQQGHGAHVRRLDLGGIGADAVEQDHAGRAAVHGRIDRRPDLVLAGHAGGDDHRLVGRRHPLDQRDVDDLERGDLVGRGAQALEHTRRGLGEPPEAHGLSGDCLRATDQRSDRRARLPSVRARDDVRIEDGQQALEIALACSCEEGVDDGPLSVEVDVRHGRTLDPPTGTARELACGRRGPADDRADLPERQGEDVVQDERDAFRRCQ